jgi:hypothetical protein
MNGRPLSGMLSNTLIGSFLLAAAICAPSTVAVAHDESKYPDWRGRWLRVSSGNFDPTKPPGLPQKPPLMPEYQVMFEASVADQAAGGQGNNPMAGCMPPGMPRMMILYGLGVEILVTPSTTFMVFGEPMGQLRRIHTDGRNWPAKVKPTFSGYSIGQWVDEDRDGRHDALHVETRAIRGPRSYDSSGMPFHRDGQAIVKERIYLDKAKRDLMHNEITVIDNALTRPWTIKREYVRKAPEWLETICGEDEHQVRIGKEDYFLSGERLLMPTREGQPPPDLRQFEQTRK